MGISLMWQALDDQADFVEGHLPCGAPWNIKCAIEKAIGYDLPCGISHIEAYKLKAIMTEYPHQQDTFDELLHLLYLYGEIQVRYE